MTKTNQILVGVLAVLALVAAALGGIIATKSGLIGAHGTSSIAQPYNETRYSGTIEHAEGLIDEPVPVVLVIRFHDRGQTGELTSPTLKRHSTLTRTGKHTYREEIVHGDGDSGTEWVFTPGSSGMDVEYTTPDGSGSAAELPQTDPEDTSGEIGLNPDIPGTEPDGITFPAGSLRSTGPIELVHADDPALNISDTVIFRIAPDNSAHTVTYADRGCYGTIDLTESGDVVETITVGDCESGGTWTFISGDISSGYAEFTSADGKLTGGLSFRHSSWDDTEGEVGIARSGPVVDVYRSVVSPAQPERSAEEGENSREARNASRMTPWGYGKLEIGMSEEEAAENGLDLSSLRPAPNGVSDCSTANYLELGKKQATVYIAGREITAITKDNGNAYFENHSIRSYQPGDDPESIVPEHKPEIEHVGEWGFHRWYLEGPNGNTLHIRLSAAEGLTTFTVSAPETACTP